MPKSTRSRSRSFDLQQHPSNELSPISYGKSIYREPRSPTAEDLIDDNTDGEDGWHSANDDSSSPTMSAPSILPQASKTRSVNRIPNLRDHSHSAPQISSEDEVKETVLKLSPAMIHELTSSPQSLPLQIHPTSKLFAQASERASRFAVGSLPCEHSDREDWENGVGEVPEKSKYGVAKAITPTDEEAFQSNGIFHPKKEVDGFSRPRAVSRTVSTPPMRRSQSPSKYGSTQPGSKQSRAVPTPLQLRNLRLEDKASALDGSMPSPMPQIIPLPPLSLPTYLQLELSSNRPSPLYIHRSTTSDFPYESSRVKIERLQNFLLLPPQLEQVLWFGALACLDSWLFSFTILPLRFLKALSILAQSWGRNLTTEIGFVGIFIYGGTGRMWQRWRRKDSVSTSEILLSPEEKTSRSPLVTEDLSAAPKFTFPNGNDNENLSTSHAIPESSHKRSTLHKHRRSKSIPSALLPDHKADILKGLLIIISCTILMHFDASRMYHSIRGQAAIKLYVIYNVLEVSI